MLRGLAALRNAAVLASRSSAPRDVQVLAARTTAGLQLWLVNLTDGTQRVRVQAAKSVLHDATVAVVGEDCVEQLSVDADGLSRQARPIADGPVELSAFAVAKSAGRPADRTRQQPQDDFLLPQIDRPGQLYSKLTSAEFCDALWCLSETIARIHQL